MLRCSGWVENTFVRKQNCVVQRLALLLVLLVPVTFSFLIFLASRASEQIPDWTSFQNIGFINPMEMKLHETMSMNTPASRRKKEGICFCVYVPRERGKRKDQKEIYGIWLEIEKEVGHTQTCGCQMARFHISKFSPFAHQISQMRYDTLHTHRECNRAQR